MNFRKNPPMRARTRPYFLHPDAIGPPDNYQQSDEDVSNRQRFNEDHAEGEDPNHGNLGVPVVPIHSGSSPVSESNASFISGLEWDPSADVGTGAVSDSGHDDGRSLQGGRHARSSSMIDLGTLDRSVQRPSNRAVNAPIANIKLNFDRVEASSKDSVVTVKDPEPARNMTAVYRNVNFGNRAQSFDESAHGSGGSKKSSSSDSANHTHERPIEPLDSSEDDPHGQREHQDQHQIPPREVSEASTDWEYDNSHSRSRSQDHSLSDWQTAGLTRSEIIYTRINDSSGSPDVMSVGVKIQPSGDNNRRRERAHSKIRNHSLLLVDRSVQTDLKVNKDESTKRKKGYHTQGQTTSESYSRDQHSRSHPIRVESSSSGTFHNHHRDRSRHHQHRSHESQRKTGWVLEHTESSQETTSTDTNLTPTCSFINHFVHGGTPITNQNILKAIDLHRYAHIDNVRQELKRIKKLQLAIDKARAHDREYKPSSASASSNILDSSDRSQILKKTHRAIETVPDRRRKRVEQKTEPVRCVPVKPPVSYFLPLPGPLRPIWIKCAPPTVRVYDLGSRDNEKENDEREYEDKNCERDEELNNRFAGLSLEETLMRKNAEFISRAKERASVIARIRDERKKRTALKREWVQSHGTQDLSSLERALPRKGPRLMTTRQIREQTQRKYKMLPEVQEKKLKQKSEREKATNRLMSNYFAGKLRQGVLNGKGVNVSPNRSVLRQF